MTEADDLLNDLISGRNWNSLGLVMEPGEFRLTMDQSIGAELIRRLGNGPLTGRRYIVINGPAGVGKTVSGIVGAKMVGDAMFLAPTHRAARVMNAKGAVDAKTIASQIYYPPLKAKDGKLRFVRRDASPISAASIVVVDECSMLNKQTVADIMFFANRVVFLGDMFQLPPTEGVCPFAKMEPDYQLTQIMRQSEGSAIIGIAHRIRFDDYPDLRRGYYGDNGEVRVCRLSELADADLVDADMIVGGRHKTRVAITARVRAALGRHGEMPVRADKVLCRGSFAGITNGEFGAVWGDPQTNGDRVRFALQTEDGGAARVAVHRDWFTETHPHLDVERYDDRHKFTFGYCITCHSAQSGQWDNVIVLKECDEPGFSDPSRWLYTGITRASKRLTIVEMDQ